MQKILLQLIEKNDIFQLRLLLSDYSTLQHFRQLSLIQYVKYFNDDMFAFLIEIGYPFTKSILNFCFFRGMLDKISLMISLGYRVSRHSIICAIRNDKFDIVKEFLHFNYTPIDQFYYTYYSASYKRIQILRYLLDIGCRYDEQASLIASQKGYLEVLQVINIFHEASVYTALFNRNMDCFRYLIERGVEYEEDEVFDYLNRHSDWINFEENWWRKLLFTNRCVERYKNLDLLVQSKKLEIELWTRMINDTVYDVMRSNELEDVIKYVCKNYL
jgi:hypothetical protein